CHALSWIVSFCHGETGGEKKKRLSGREVVKPAPLEKQDMVDIRYSEKRKIPAGTHRRCAGGDRNNKGAGFSALDVTVLFQVVHEMLRRVGPYRHPVQFPVPPGEIRHILLVGAFAVEPAALT